MEQEILQALLQYIEKHPKGDENKEWLIRLIHNSLNNTSSFDIDADLIYNATVGENILANLLAVDIKTIVKVRMLQKIINALWEENNWDMAILNKYILNEKPDQQEISPNGLKNINTEEMEKEKSDKELIEELSSPEIEMIDNDSISITTRAPDTKVEVESTFQPTITSNLMDDNISTEIIGIDISKTSRYEFRNRTTEALNPYYITKNKFYMLGALEVNIPGKNNEEQKAYIASYLKLPPKNNLIQRIFWKGNYWLALEFDYNEDIVECKNMLNTKEKELIKFIQLAPEINEKEDENKNNQQRDIDRNQHNKKEETNMTRLFVKTTLTENKKEEVDIEEQNPFKLTSKQTWYKGGFLTAKLPGDNRLEQFNNIAKILRIPTLNNFITHIFHQGNSWLAISFCSQKDLDICIETIDALKDENVRLVDISDKNKTHKKQQHTNDEEVVEKAQQQEQTYMLTDIPLDFNGKKIKKALKPFGNIHGFQITKKGKWKLVSFTVQQTKNSYSLENR